MNARELVDQANKKFDSFDIRGIMPALRGCNEGALNDILNRERSGYYQWTPGLIDVLKPKQIVELGAAMGAWDIMACNSAYQDFTLYAITLAEHGLEYSFITDTYPNLVKIVGDDLLLSNWPSDLDLSETDLWFLDSEHTYEQLNAEVELYAQFFKKGTVLLFDDIRMAQLWPIWERLTKDHDAIELTNPLHYSGYGLIVW